MQEEIQVPYMTLLQQGITSCPNCFVEMKSEKPLEAQKCPGCNLSLYMPLILDEYILYKPLGTGGVGHVYKAMKKNDKGRYAVKLFHCGENTEENEHPIVREAISGHSVGKHPNLVPVLQFGHAKDEFYIAFPFVEGERLDEYISRKKHLSEKRAFNIMVQIIEAEEFICSKGYLFRDLKPENIILEKNGTVKICDYGLCIPLEDAKINGEDVLPDEIEGSPFYIPPERILGTTEGEFSEIYSLGMILFHCLSGKTYFSETEIDELVAKHIEKLPSVSVRNHLHNCHEKTICIIDKMIKKVPTERYQDFKSLKEEIKILEKDLLQRPSFILKSKKP